LRVEYLPRAGPPCATTLGTFVPPLGTRGAACVIGPALKLTKLHPGWPDARSSVLTRSLTISFRVGVGGSTRWSLLPSSPRDLPRRVILGSSSYQARPHCPNPIGPGPWEGHERPLGPGPMPYALRELVASGYDSQLPQLPEKFPRGCSKRARVLPLPAPAEALTAGFNERDPHCMMHVCDLDERLA